MEKKVDSIIRIALVGPESTGKTILCEQLAKYYNTVYVPEYARTYFEVHDINNYDTSDLEIIAKKQLELEAEYLPKANRFLFCDTSLITIKIWCTHKFNKVPSFITKSIKDNDYDLSLDLKNIRKYSMYYHHHCLFDRIKHIWLSIHLISKFAKISQAAINYAEVSIVIINYNYCSYQQRSKKRKKRRILYFLGI